MIFLLYFLSSAFANRISVGLAVGPQQVVASYHRTIWSDVIVGAHLSGTRFFEKICNSDYKETDAVAPTFSCERVETGGTHLGLEALYGFSLPDFMNQYPVATMGSYLGTGYYEDGFFARFGLIANIRMDWKPLDFALRTSVGHHGVMGTVYGVGVFAVFHLSTPIGKKNQLY